MAVSDPPQPTAEQPVSARAADDLEQGWIVRPFLRVNAGQTSAQEVSSLHEKWSHDKQLWWIGGQPEDKLTLGFHLPKDGDYELFVRLTKARDYGIVQLSLDGHLVIDKIDLYAPEPTPSGELSMGSHHLSAGEHSLQVKIVGSNPQAEKAYMFGIDYLRQEPSAGPTT